MGVDAQTIDAGTRAAEAVARPAVFAPVVALLLLALNAFIVWRQEARAEEQTAVLVKIELRLEHIEQLAAERPLVAPAVARIR